MAVKSWRSSQVAHTREALVKAARRLFGARGYAGTPLAEVCRRTGMTRGAVYHHFADKRELFEEVVISVVRDAVYRIDRETLERGIARGEERGAEALAIFFDALREPTAHRILLVDAPAVLGRERWSEVLAARLLAPLRRAVGALAAQGRLDPVLVPAVAHLLFGTVREGALLLGPERTAAGGPVARGELDRALAWLGARLFEDAAD
jgi:AcrR family transcriptional regulator